ncbi:HWE histidine kinase domain-containing protein, partial [Pandoraea pneumonica]
RHFRTLASPVHLPEGPILEWLGTSTDVDDLLQLQAQQEILVKELQHRTRNVMAVVQAVAGRTLKESQSLEQFAERFEDRLQALARVQGL